MDNIMISKKDLNKRKPSSFISKIITKILLSIIFLLSSLIFTNLSTNNYAFYKENIINNTFRYTKIKKYYEKYFGKVISKKENKDIPVFSESPVINKIEPYEDKEKLIFNGETDVSAVQSGIVVYIGDKDDLGYTIIIQGIDDVDIWYSNISDCKYKLYDYVEKDKTIGKTNDYIIINIIKNNNHIKYEEYLKTI